MAGSRARLALVAVAGAVFVLAGLPAHARGVVWYRQFSTVGADPTNQLDQANGVATDSATNVYVVGIVAGTLPGQTSSGKSDAFIRKYDPSGTELWTRQFGSSSWDHARAVALDEAGGVYVLGSAGDALPGQTFSGGHNDAFVRRYDTAGNEVWTRQFGTAGFDFGDHAGVDGTGNLYVIGTTTGAFPGYPNPVGYKTFVRKYDPNGTELWTKQFAKTSLESGTVGAAVDAAGNLYLAGDQPPTAVSGNGAWIGRYGTGGARQWLRRFGEDEDMYVGDLAVDSSGNARVTGDRVDRPNGILGQRLGTRVGFIRTYQPSGSVISSVKVDGIGFPQSIAVGSDGASYLVSFGGQFLAKVAADGTQLWQDRIHRDNVDPLDLAVDPAGNLILVGVADHAADASSEEGDAFVMKVDQSPSCADTSNPTAEEDGALSRGIHFRVEPAVDGLEPIVHDVNCTVVVPLGL